MRLCVLLLLSGFLSLTNGFADKEIELSPETKKLIELAESGDALAQASLGSSLLHRGTNRPPDFDGALMWLTKSANAGEPLAQFRLGVMYHQFNMEDGVDHDMKKAEYWYLKAAEAGYPPAMRQIGMVYKQSLENGGKGINWLETLCKLDPQNLPNRLSRISSINPDEDTYRATLKKEQALASVELAKLYLFINGPRVLEYATFAAEAGEPDGQALLGTMYYYGKRIEKNAKLGLKWLTIAAEEGVLSAQIELAFHNKLLHEKSGEEPLGEHARKAANWFRAAAGQGHSNSQLQLGLMYLEGVGREQDVEAAERWLQRVRRTAEEGQGDAQFCLGLMYEEGRGVEMNEGDAAMWYQKAAAQGIVEAQHNLARLHFLGRGVKQDDDEAAKWFRKAALQSNASATHMLGRMYEAGRGVAKDEGLAAWLYRVAAVRGITQAQNDLTQLAIRGIARAQCELADMYLYGQVVKQDDDEAAKWYRKAAEQGYLSAQLELGRMHEIGRGVTKDTTEAAKWYRKAAEQGSKRGEKSLKMLEGK
jgi:TPR repeat protein